LTTILTTYLARRASTASAADLVASVLMWT
jgi:hypothetical protein